jgi:hypothetical protein
MFKLGEYDEVEAADIAAYLKKAGVRVELKPSISAFMESAIYMEGRLSQLKERVEDFEVYDRYIGALKAALAEGGEAEDFTDRYLSILDPSWNRKKDEMAGFLEDESTISDEGLGSPEEMMDQTTAFWRSSKPSNFWMQPLNSMRSRLRAIPEASWGTIRCSGFR